MVVLQNSTDFVKSEPGLSSESFSPSRDECHVINIKVEDLPVLEEEEEEEEEEDPEPVISPSIDIEHEVSFVCICVCVCVCVCDRERGTCVHACVSIVSHVSEVYIIVFWYHLYLRVSS
jgi:hypothetical protein